MLFWAKPHSLLSLQMAAFKRVYCSIANLTSNLNEMPPSMKKPRTVLGWGVRGPDILSRGVYFTVQIIASKFQAITSHARHRAVNSTDHYLCRPSLPRCSAEACLVCPHFLRIKVYVWISENTRQIQVLSVPAAVCACTRCGREMVINTARTPLKCVKALSVRQSWWLLKGILKRQHEWTGIGSWSFSDATN